MSSSTKSPNAENRRTLEDVIKPIETAATILILCVSGITLANLYFGANYTSRIDRLRARNESLSKSFEIFNDFCLFSGMFCIFVYLVWSNRESKELMFEDSYPQDIPTKEGQGTSYLFRSSTVQGSSIDVSTQQQFLSTISLPQYRAQSFYNRFRSIVGDSYANRHNANVDTEVNILERRTSEIISRPKVTKISVCELPVPTLGDNY
eukprot:snap_masked-scaffold_14-processed-gene-6.33-mRNA-1 protein AED:1.00 eAED:1.00 QI:0/0/0/0/1/1/2/0/206